MPTFGEIVKDTGLAFAIGIGVVIVLFGPIILMVKVVGYLDGWGKSPATKVDGLDA